MGRPYSSGESARQYTEAQKTIVRILAKEGCSRLVISIVTGIPYGSLYAFCKKLSIDVQGSRGVGIGKQKQREDIAEKIALMRQKYMSEINDLFGSSDK